MRFKDSMEIEIRHEQTHLHCVVTHQIICDAGSGLGSIEIDSANHGSCSDLAVLSLHCL